MGMRWTALLLCSALGFFAVVPHSRAGDEDVRAEAPHVEAPPPADAPLPEGPDAPEMSIDEAPPPAPEFGADAAPPPAARRARNPRWPYDPDRNIDYSELMGMVETAEPGRGVLPPAPGFRGYRPNMVALEAGDRTPGFGVLVEYSWNRLGLGAFYSYRNVSDADALATTQSFFGGYGLYRWLPWDFSPYFLVGVELGSSTPETFGGMGGIGMEGRLWYGATVLLGWTYHSAAQKGFFGGGIGWSF